MIHGISSNLANRETPDQYIKKKQEGLYFVLERFCNSNADFWNAFASKQSKEARKLHNSSEGKMKEAIITGTIGFSDSLVCHQIFAKKSSRELWILFAVTKLSQAGSCPDVESLEMVCTVSTASDAPFTTHMGVFRTIHSNLGNHKHPNISMALHAFGAEVMKRLYPDKQYMITTPMPHMETIFKKALGEMNVHIALEKDWKRYIKEKEEEISLLSKESRAPDKEKNNEIDQQLETAKKTIEYYKNRIAACSSQVVIIGKRASSFTLKDLNGKEIISLDKYAMNQEYDWYFKRETTFSGINNMVAIPLQILANYRA